MEPALDHRALLYDGSEAYLAGTVPFILEGLERGEPVLVAVPAANLDLLRVALGSDADRVEMVDMAQVGGNPARIIPMWADFVVANATGGRAVRGIGEPIWSGRSEAELVECHRHEALINVAFRSVPGPVQILCPYDTTALGAEVLVEAHGTHPVMVEGGVAVESGAFPPLARIAEPFAAPLPPPPAAAVALSFVADDLFALRRVVRRLAADAGLDGSRLDDLVLAVHEVATNSVRYGGGGGDLRVWEEGGVVLCQVEDAGLITDPLAGRSRSAMASAGGRGLWLANHLCDLLQIRSDESGSVVRMHMRRHPAAPPHRHTG